MTTLAQRASGLNLWAVRSSDTQTTVMLRRARMVLAGLMVLLALYQLVTDGQDYVPVLFCLWLAFTFIIPVHGILIGYCILTVYPISRALTISLRPSGNLLQTSLYIIPPDATL